MKRPCHECGREFDAKTVGLCCDDCSPIRYEVKTKAMSAVAAAVRDRVLPNLRIDITPCTDCGTRADRYDHRDYNKPLDVQPVCRACNRKRGPAARLEAA